MGNQKKYNYADRHLQRVKARHSVSPETQVVVGPALSEKSAFYRKGLYVHGLYVH